MSPEPNSFVPDTTQKLKLFVSHAHEDKVEFVEPLAMALKESFQVWYDRFVLKLGDSLLKEISRGLSECDYGVVVLSPSFFSKHWAQNELTGLFALEDASRKVILPIWKDISREEVMKFSPMLADRVAVKAEEGIERVVEQIKLAVEFGARAVQVSGAIARLTHLDQDFKTRKTADNRLYSTEGANAVRAEFNSLIDRVEQKAFEFSGGSDELKFSCTRHIEKLIVVTSMCVGVEIGLDNLASNSARTASLECRYFCQHEPRPPEYRSEPDEIGEQKFYPYFDTKGAVVWATDERKRSFETTDVVSEMIFLEIGRLLEIDERDGPPMPGIHFI